MSVVCKECGTESFDELLCSYCGYDFGFEFVHGTYDPDTDKAWEEGWESKGKTLGAQETSNRWNLGKWVDEGFKKYGTYYEPPSPLHPFGISFYSHASDITGLEPGHLKDLRSTWVRWEGFASVRTDNLTWSHHRVLINELKEPTEETLKEWRDKAVENQWSARELGKQIRNVKGKEPPPSKGIHRFEVAVPDRTWVQLKRLGATGNGPVEAAENILVEHCDDPGVQQIADVFQGLKDQQTHEARVKHGKRIARAYDPLDLQRDR